MDKIAVLIPCYNEGKTIQKVVRDFKAALPQAVVYVYDNNSSDDTAALAEEAGAIVRRETKQGKGNVIRSMFRDINAQCYIMADGDDTYPAEYASRMCREVLENGCDMVIGDRLSSTYFTENKRAFHGFGNKLVRRLINFFFKSDIQDIMTGYRAFSYLFVKTYPVLSRGFEVETEMTIHALDKNLHTNNVVIDYRDRPAGSESKLNTYTDGAKVIKTIVKLFKNYKPFAFFSLIALLLVAVGLVFLVPVLIDYYKMGIVPKFPRFIASVAFALMAIQAFFGGLILDTLVKADKQRFELKLNETKDRFDRAVLLQNKGNE